MAFIVFKFLAYNYMVDFSNQLLILMAVINGKVTS